MNNNTKKIIFLLPPSEGKNDTGGNESEQLSFIFEKPRNIAIGATAKDLHCKDKRFEQAQVLNQQTLDNQSVYTRAIERYSGVMYNAIDYVGMNQIGKQFFEENFLIVSGMYGLVKPTDMIGNYKLPIGTKGLYKFWGDTLTQAIDDMKSDIVVNLLPQAYAKAIDFDKIQAQVVHVAFMKYKEDNLVNMAHGVKKVKGEWLKNVCENRVVDYTQFQGDVLAGDNSHITVRIIHNS